LALEFHPDRNQGDPDAQAKFILISKSYECFTDETKTANCFKYGNPDGAGSFRVGIGLPKFFIEVEYKWYVLPVVLAIFLIVVPCFILSWSNRNRSLDSNGISVRGYRTLFQCMETAANKYSSIALLSSYVELWEHP
jgi:preprotein translocase subunit Sec63